MRLIGLTGGIATGKSTFADALRARGAPVIDADRLARAAVARGSPGLAEVVKTFGSEVLLPDGELDRKRMASLVFSDRAALARLEAIVHPAVRALCRAEIDRLAAAGASYAFYEVPLLFEVQLEREVDWVVVVYAPRDLQTARLMERDGLDRSAAEARLSAQLPIEEKAARADVVVVNDSDPQALQQKAEHLLRDLARLSRRLPNAPPARY